MVPRRMVLRARPLGRRLFSETHREIKGEEAMEHLGSSLALQVPKRAGNVLFLVGDLGCGKTCFARGFVRAWCQDEQLDVTSPTYLLINTYEPPVDTKRSTLYHLDLYRLESVTATDAQALGLEDVFSTGTSIVEWPDRLQDKPAERLEVHIEYTDAQDERRVRVEGYGSVWKPVEDLFRVN